MAEVAPFADVTCEDMTATNPPCRLILRASSFRLQVAAEKRGAAMQLQLRPPVSSPRLAAALSDWQTGGKNELIRVVSLDDAEAVIVALSAALRPVLPLTDAAPTSRAEDSGAGQATG